MKNSMRTALAINPFTTENADSIHYKRDNQHRELWQIDTLCCQGHKVGP